MTHISPASIDNTRLTSSVTGIILAGGAGNRMGGKDKGWISFNQQPLITHVLSRLSPQVTRVIISANRELDRYKSLGALVVVDEEFRNKNNINPSFQGPISGIIAALRQVTTSHAVIVPVDAPLLPESLVKTLLEPLSMPESSVSPLTLINDGERTQPLFGLYKQSLLRSLEEYYQAGNRRLMEWCCLQSPHIIQAPQLQSSFINLNSQENLSALESSLKPSNR